MVLIDAIDIGDSWAAAGAGGRPRPGGFAQIVAGICPRKDAAKALRAGIVLKSWVTY